MKGNDKVLNLLNEVLTAELTAINQYFIHARMCENWGYDRLYKKIRAESIGEMKHADELIVRILYLEGVPNLQRLGKVNVGQTVSDTSRCQAGIVSRLRQSPPSSGTAPACSACVGGR